MNTQLPAWPPLDASGQLLPLAQVRHALIEASAGTGKTYQTEGLAVRLVVEQGIAIDRLLVITFTRAATAELRARVRERLLKARLRFETGSANDPKDDVLEALCVGTAAELAERRERVETALRDYDRAPISTIHGFCQRMLEAEAFAASEDPQPEVTSDAKALRERYIGDVLCGAFAGMSEQEAGMLEAQGMTLSLMSQTAKVVSGAGNERCEPGGVPGHVGELVWLARERAKLLLKSWDEALAWMDSPEAEATYVALCTAVARMSANPVGLLLPGIATDHARAWAELRRWLEAGGAATASADLKKTFLEIRTRWDDKLDKRPGGKSFEESPFYGLERVLKPLSGLAEAWTLPDFAASARVAYQRELAARGMMTYDEMITRLAVRLRAEDDQAAQPLRQALRGRFDAALIDEFQDTDQSQWTIAQRVFLQSSAHFLYVVGDPKQAIYRFRGANLGVYLAAASHFPERFSLVKNQRSDPSLLDQLNTVWSGATDPFRDTRIGYARVEAAKTDRCSGLGAPLELRSGGDLDLPTVVARYVRSLIENTQAQIEGQRVKPGNIAILCPTHSQLNLIRDALARIGIAARTGNNASVFESPAASWLLGFLDALAAPTAETPTRLLALTPLIGWSMTELAVAIEGKDAEKLAWSELRERVVRWAERSATAGFMAVFEGMTGQYDTLARLVGGRFGERAAADLRDLAERLHTLEKSTRLPSAGLAAWLRAQVAGADDGDETQMQTVETDADAVILSTVHSAKGLQYPIVLLPYQPKERGKEYKPVVYTPKDVTDGSRTVDLHPDRHPKHLEAEAREADESEQERVRVLYVAMTRAIHKVVMWAEPGTPEGKPDRFGNSFEALVKGDPTRLPTVVDEAPLALEHTVGGESDATPPPNLTSTAWGLHAEPGAGWRITSFTGLSGGRGVDLEEVESDPPDADTADETGEAIGADIPEPDDGSARSEVEWASLGAFKTLLERPSLQAAAVGEGFFGGTTTGTWLHHLFEDIDFKPTDPPGDSLRSHDGSDLAVIAKARGERDGVTDETQHALAVELMPVWLSTPLGGDAVLKLPGNFTLAKIGREDRMDELKFDLRIASGLDRRGHGEKTRSIDPAGMRLVYAQAIADGARSQPWLQHLLDLPGVLRDKELVDRNLIPKIAGMLTGSMDLLFRALGTDGQERFYVCDYKSNALTGGHAAKAAVEAKDLPRIPVPANRERGTRATTRPRRVLRAHYTGPMMAWGMAHHAYHLQALVYTVALHRHLRQRLGTSYDYDKHIGGHLYLFLRGMEGPMSPDGERLGVWADRWSKATVVGMDLVLAGATADEVKQALPEMTAPANGTGEGGRA